MFAPLVSLDHMTLCGAVSEVPLIMASRPTSRCLDFH